MARIRTVKPEFFRHEGLQDLEAANPGAYVMLVFAGLWGHCDKNGRFEWKPRMLKLDILPFLPFDMDGTLELLGGAGFIKQYEAGGRLYGEIDSFEKHQRISGKELTDGAKHPEPDEYKPAKQEGSDGEATGKQPVAQEGKGREQEEEGNRNGKDVALRARREQVAAVFDHWRQVMGHPKAKPDDKRGKLIEARLKGGYSVEDLKAAIDGCSKSPFHMGSNEQGTRYDGLELILRDGSKVDKFLAINRNPPRPQGRQGAIEARNQAAVDEFLSGSASNGFDGYGGDTIDMEVQHD